MIDITLGLQLFNAFFPQLFSILSVGNIIEDSVRAAIDVIEELNDMLKSGEMESYLDAIAGKFSGFSDDIGRDIETISELWNEFLKTDLGENTQKEIDFVIDAFKNLPENFRAIVQIITVELASLIEYGKAYGKGFVDVLSAELDKMVGKAGVYARAILAALNPFDGGGATIDVNAELRALDSTAAEVLDNVRANINRVSEVRRDSIASILEERQAALDSFDDQIKKGKELREQYDFLTASKKAFGALETVGFTIEDLGRGKDLLVTYEGVTKEVHKSSDAFIAYLDSLDIADEKARKLIATLKSGTFDPKAFDLGVLGQFKVGGEGDSGESETERKASEKLEKQLEREKLAREREFENLRQSLLTEEEAIQESYDRRLAIILENTEEGSQKQADLKARLDKEFATQAIGNLDSPDTYEEQIAEIEEFYASRRELILNNVALTEEQRTELEEELTRQRNERLNALEQERVSSILQGGAQVFDGLAGLAKTYAGEQSGIYKSLFAVSKAFALADAIIKIQQGIAQAASLPFPANLAAMGTVAAATGSIVSTISGTQFSGAYDKGGDIPSGKIGLVGEFGPELIQGPATVTSRKETAKMFREAANAPEQQPVVNVKNINVLDPSLVGDYLGTDEGEQMIMNVVQRNQRSI